MRKSPLVICMPGCVSVLNTRPSLQCVAATDPSGEEVAAKVLTVRGLRSWKQLDLFEREAAALRALRHPGIPHYRGFWSEKGTAGPRFVLVQELAQGSSLAALVATGARPGEAEVARMARDALRILRYLASRRPPVAHRDVSPANLVVRPILPGDQDSCVALVDFGAVAASRAGAFGDAGAEEADYLDDDREDDIFRAAQAGAGSRGWERQKAQKGGSSQTGTVRRGSGDVASSSSAPSRLASTVVGTVGFMAPEQLAGDATPASDLYGLGATLLWVLTGALGALEHAGC